MLPLRVPAPLVREAPAIYRPRRPQEGPLYRLLEDRFEEFALLHEERFEREDGPLRPVVRRVVNEFLDCGIPENGYLGDLTRPPGAPTAAGEKRAERKARSRERRRKRRLLEHMSARERIALEREEHAESPPEPDRPG